MTLDLETLQEMWEKDSKIDPDNLHNESLNIPVLHAKYHELYNNMSLLRKKAEQQRKNIRHERYEYFSGKSDPEVYLENPFPKKIRDKDTMQKYMDADEKLSNSSLKIEYYDTILSYIDSILKQISNRTYQIKKKSVWSSTYNIFQGNKIIGVFNHKWKTGGYSLILNDSKKSY